MIHLLLRGDYSIKIKGDGRMNELKIFENSEFGKVRTVLVDGEPYFVGKDVAEVLGYSNTQKAIRDHVDRFDKLTERIVLSGQNREVILINESGLYSLILSSKMPRAREFKHWVTSEILPSIRRHGLYAVDEVLADPDMLINALTALKEERAKTKVLEEQNAIQNQQIAELQPKASYYDLVLNCKDLVSVTTIAKDYGWSARKMNTYLHDLGVQYKQGSVWILYQKYAEMGYTITKTHSHPGKDGDVHATVHTYWTQKGRLFIYSLLKENGILPMVERGETA